MSTTTTTRQASRWLRSLLRSLPPRSPHVPPLEAALSTLADIEAATLTIPASLRGRGRPRQPAPRPGDPPRRLTPGEARHLALHFPSLALQTSNCRQLMVAPPPPTATNPHPVLPRLAHVRAIHRRARPMVWTSGLPPEAGIPEHMAASDLLAYWAAS